MTRELAAILDDLERGVEAEDATSVIEAATALRRRLTAMLEDRRLEVEDPLLRRRRHLHQRLEVLEAKARARRFDDADEDAEAVADMARELAAGLRERETEDAEAERSTLPRPVRASLLVARREAARIAATPGGALLAGLSLLVVSLALQAARGTDPQPLWDTAREPLLAVAPLAGLVAGVDRLGQDARAGRLPLLSATGLPRWSLVAAKALGAAAALALVLLGPAILVLAVAAILGVGLAPATAATALLAVLLAATSFAAIAFAFEALHGEASVTLAGTVSAYLLLGPVWRAAFEAGADGSSTGALAATLLHRLSPVSAADSAIAAPAEAGGTGVLGLAVLVAWTLAGLALAAFLVHRDGFERPDRA